MSAPPSKLSGTSPFLNFILEPDVTRANARDDMKLVSKIYPEESRMWFDLSL